MRNGQFVKISPRIRRGHGKYNITYRNGTFRMNKFTVEAAGSPDRVELLHNPQSDEVLIKPTHAEDAHKLIRTGCDWPNSFASLELARRLHLPEKGATVRFFTEWDEEAKALRFKAHDQENVA
jgi:hypothetical protein